VQRGPLGEHRGEGRRVKRSQFLNRGLVPQPLDKIMRRGKRSFERHLLIEQHPDQECERVPRQQFVGLVVNRQRDRHSGPPRCGARWRPGDSPDGYRHHDT
jgi:hypothetical protein